MQDNHQKKVLIVVLWICIPSILLVGCIALVSNEEVSNCRKVCSPYDVFECNIQAGTKYKERGVVCSSRSGKPVVKNLNQYEISP